MRVVDYKTGRVLDEDIFIDDDNAEKIAKSIFDPETKQRPKIAFQFYIYDMLMKGRKEIEGKRLYNCVYSTSRLFNRLPEAVPLNQLFYEQVSALLKETLDKMCDPTVNFTRTSDEEHVCKYCDFKMICGR